MNPFPEHLVYKLDPTMNTLRQFQVGRIRTVTSAILSCLFIGQCVAHEHPGYRYDASIGTRNPDWMAAYPDSLRISELSIPGTHDTMSDGPGGHIVQNQTASLQEQLLAGVRALDIRCRHIGDRFAMHHGSQFLGTFFGNDVLRVCQDFLKAHPGETILMRIKSEHTEEGNTREFYETFEWYRSQYPSLFWSPGDSDNPALGEVRGKVVVLKNFNSFEDYGINWPSALGKATGAGADDRGVQDWYALTTNWDLYEKWTYVRDHLKRARDGDSNQLYFNWLSAAYGSFPYFVASGHSNPATGAPRLSTGLTTPGWKDSYPDFPRVNCFLGICTIAFEGTNVLTTDKLNLWYFFGKWLGFDPHPRVGIIYADFPGPGLINAVIRTNQNLLTRGVTNTQDSGPGSLRAVAQAEPYVGFNEDLSNKTITLTSGDVTINQTITIDATPIPGEIRITADKPTRIGR